MFRLVLNDWIAALKWLLTIICYFTLVLFFLGGNHNYAGILNSALVLVSIFFVEERWRTNVLSRSLPLSPSKIVLARHLSVWLPVFFLMVYEICFQIIWVLLQPHSSFRILGSLPIGFIINPITHWICVCAILFAIFIPIFFGFGTMRPILFGLFAAWILLSTSPFNIEPMIAGTAHELSIFPTMALGVLFLIGLQLISYAFSLWLFKRREF
jgi:ABC-2 family transporter protein